MRKKEWILPWDVRSSRSPGSLTKRKISRAANRKLRGGSSRRGPDRRWQTTPVEQCRRAARALLVTGRGVRETLYSLSGRFLHARLGLNRVFHASPFSALKLCECGIHTERRDRASRPASEGWRLLGRSFAATKKNVCIKKKRNERKRDK